MKRKLGTLVTTLLLIAIAVYLTQGKDSPASQKTAASPEKGAGQVFKIPSAADLERLKAEKGMKASAAALKKMKPATVERVVDGDTVELIIDGKKEKVRLLNVNTPETVDPRRPVQTYGKEASAFTKSVLTKGTKLFVKPDVEEKDKYDRLLLHLYLEDGTWFNALLIRAGYAQLMTIAPNVSAADFFKELQRKAREEEIGLWQISEYQSPPKK